MTAAKWDEVCWEKPQGSAEWRYVYFMRQPHAARWQREMAAKTVSSNLGTIHCHCRTQRSGGGKAADIVVLLVESGNSRQARLATNLAPMQQTLTDIFNAYMEKK